MAEERGPAQSGMAGMRLSDVTPSLLQDLRSDHAGETGAVAIYHGMLAVAGSRVARNRVVWTFAASHLATEKRHLAAFDELLPASQRSLLLPLWRLAGWLLGALGALGGPRTAFLTVEAVETFVVEHYQRQIDSLPGVGSLGVLRATLQAFQDDEDHHRRDASQRRERALRWWERGWCRLVAAGSAAAVGVARRI